MFWNRKERHDAAEDGWGDLASFAELMAVTLEPLEPAPSFRWELRERLVEAAAHEIERREAATVHRQEVMRGVLVGAGAAAAAAAAGAALLFWRRNHPDSFGHLLHARGA